MRFIRVTAESQSAGYVRLQLRTMRGVSGLSDIYHREREHTSPHATCYRTQNILQYTRSWLPALPRCSRWCCPLVQHCPLSTIFICLRVEKRSSTIVRKSGQLNIFQRRTLTTISLVIVLLAEMHLMYTLDAAGNRVYTMKVNYRLVTVTPFYDEGSNYLHHYYCILSNTQLIIDGFQKEDLVGKPTTSAYPVRFSPDDKFTRERIICKKRFNVLPTQGPPKEY